jgi:hypothetical protein
MDMYLLFSKEVKKHSECQKVRIMQGYKLVIYYQYCKQQINVILTVFRANIHRIVRDKDSSKVRKTSYYLTPV